MTTVNLQSYAPIINDPSKGEEILNKIKSCDPSKNVVTVDFIGIVSMTTFCAKQIFGTLFKELGSETFLKNIIIKNASDDVYLVIKLGLEGTINEVK